MSSKIVDSIAEKTEYILGLGGIKKDIAFLVVSALALLASIFEPFSLPFNPAWIAVVLCGIPIVLEAIIGLVTAFDIKADVLVSMALIASICIGEDFAAGEVAFIMQLGALLEDITVAKARAGIEKLVHLTPRTARIITPDGEKIIPAREVLPGQIIRVLPGETSVNQAVMTGESLPVDKTVGDQVSSGTVNQFGAFEMEALKVGEDSSIQRMIRLVQSADAGKAKIVGLADRWATWIVVTALTAAGLTWAFTGEIIRAVTILVVFCPCSLVLATPTAIMAAIGNSTKHGFLIREGDALERLSGVTKITFDKTGTLTYGKPKVVKVFSVLSGFTEEDLFRIVASAEQFSEHPLGKAVAGSYKKQGGKLSPCEDFLMVPGGGVSGKVEGKTVSAGNLKLMESSGILLPENLLEEGNSFIKEGCTVIYTAVDNIPAGLLVLSDTIREDAPGMVAGLETLGVQPVLLTGDNRNASETVGKRLGIREIIPECLPEDKLNRIGEYQDSGNFVCMIGDGINDAPALKKADVGIAMGGIGSDIAVEAADIALVNDEIRELPHLFALSKRMMNTIRANILFSMGLNFLAIGLAITGILNPVVGALVHNAGSVVVIVNSALLLRWKKNSRKR